MEKGLIWAAACVRFNLSNLKCDTLESYLSFLLLCCAEQSWDCFPLKLAWDEGSSLKCILWDSSWLLWFGGFKEYSEGTFQLQKAAMHKIKLINNDSLSLSLHTRHISNSDDSDTTCWSQIYITAWQLREYWSMKCAHSPAPCWKHVDLPCTFDLPSPRLW